MSALLEQSINELKAVRSQLTEILDAELPKTENGKVTDLYKRVERINAKIAGLQSQLKQQQDNEKRVAEKAAAQPQRPVASTIDNRPADELMVKYANVETVNIGHIEAAIDDYMKAAFEKDAFKSANRDVLDEKREKDAGERNARRRIYGLLAKAAATMPDEDFESLKAQLQPIVGYQTATEVRGDEAEIYRWCLDHAPGLLLVDRRQFERYMHTMEAIRLAESPDVDTDTIVIDRETYDNLQQQLNAMDSGTSMLTVNRSVLDKHLRLLDELPYFAVQPIPTAPAAVIRCTLPTLGNPHMYNENQDEDTDNGN